MFLATALKPKAAGLLTTLWSVHHQLFPDGALPPPGRVAVACRADVPEGFYNAAGYVKLGNEAMRADMAERLAASLRRAARNQPFAVTPEMLSLAGVGHDRIGSIIEGLGYRQSGDNGCMALYTRQRTPSGRGSRWASTNRRAGRRRTDSPFAILDKMGTAD